MRALAVVAFLATAGCIQAAALPDLPEAAEGPAVSAAVVRLGSGVHAMEPHVAVRGDTIVVGHMAEFRAPLPDGATTRIEIHRSLDAGETWTSAVLPLARSDLPVYRSFSGDVVLAFAPDGVLYAAGVAARGVDVGGCCLVADLAVHVLRSDDLGATWSGPVFVSDGLGPTVAGVLQDKPWLTVGPEGTIHLGWTRFTTVFHTTILTTRSTDGGATWAPERVLVASDPTDYDQYSGLTLAAPGDGLVYASWTVIEGGSPSNPGQQVVAVSADDGATFGAPVPVSGARFPGFGAVFADPSDAARASVVVPDLDGRAVLVATEDAGATWSPPLQLSSRAGPEPLAAGVVDAEGAARVAYYATDWPGGMRAVAATVRSGVVVAEEPLGDAPIRPAERMREYLGVAGDGENVWAAWVAGDASTSTWIEAQRIR